MSRIPFSHLPDSARVWIFASPRALQPTDAETLLARVDERLESWLAHGRRVIGAREWRYDRFLLIGADEAASGVSGCSIDSLFHTLQATEQDLGISLLDPSPVWYRDGGGEIQALSRREFRERVRSGGVTEDTVVFNHTVSIVGEVRGGAWETPLRESWHARAFLAAAGSA